MSGRLYKSSLAIASALLLLAVSFIQSSLVRDREQLGLNAYTDELRGASPLLSLTTVALGGFRGLISNFLWMRASRLQEQNKYFEMVQLADWITKLEPHFTQVWLMEGWNMAFNISVEFSDAADRWRWVERGMELMRDDGLKYNPYDILLHRELAWLFQFKMGANMDDAQMYYKQAWAVEMYRVFHSGSPNWDELVNPQTDDARRRAALLRDKYKMDAALMKQVDETYGPLDWRLPEAHAIYWAFQGLQMADKNEQRINPDDIITLRRVIYQSLHLAVQRGRLVTVDIGSNRQEVIDFGPNMTIIPKANKAYEDALKDERDAKFHGLLDAHRFFLLDAVFILYMNGRDADAQQWYRYLAEKYPTDNVLEGRPHSTPGQTSMEDYVMGRTEEEFQASTEYNTRIMLEGLERRALLSLAHDDDRQAAALDDTARRLHERYDHKIEAVTTANNTNAPERLYVAPLPNIRSNVLQQLLTDLPTDLALRLATKTGQTNLPPQRTSTPAPPPPQGK